MKVQAEITYEKFEQIGQGLAQNSRVYRAHDTQFAGVIAVKEIERDEFCNDVDAYFLEAQAMYQVPHQNIVPVHYACLTASHVCIAMPYFSRGSFQSVLKQGPAPLSQCLAVGRGVLAALAQVHRAGLLHLDVKPSNVLLSTSGVPTLADFGQSRRLSAKGLARPSGVYGWGGPPEAFRGVVAVPSDVFQAGVLLYRAVNGDPHFDRQRPAADDSGVLQRAFEEGKFPDRSDFLPHVPPRLRTVIRKALNVDPSHRYQAATDFADGLGGVPCTLDWHTRQRTDGGFEWRARRAGQAPLLVTAVPTAARWSIAVCTERDGVPRAKDKAMFWRTDLGRKDAWKHLNEVFDRLGR